MAGLSDPICLDGVKSGVILAAFITVSTCRPHFACKGKIDRIKRRSEQALEPGSFGMNLPTLLALLLASAALYAPATTMVTTMLVWFCCSCSFVRRDPVQPDVVPEPVLNSSDNRFFGVGSVFGKDDAVSAMLHDLALLVAAVIASKGNKKAIVASFAAFFTAAVRLGFIPGALPLNFNESMVRIWNVLAKHLKPAEGVVVNSGINFSSRQNKSILTVVVVAVASLATLINGDFSPDRVMTIYDGFLGAYDSNPVRFGSNIVEAIRISFVSIMSYVKTGEFDWLNAGTKDFADLSARYEELLGQYNAFGNSGNDPDSSSMVSRAQVLESETRKVVTMCGTLKTFSARFTRAAANTFLASVVQLRTKICARHHLFGIRRAPFTALVVGPPSIGKTTLTNHIVSIFCSVYNYAYKDELIFKPNKSSDYDDGFQSNMHSCILDDVAELRPAKVQGVDPSIGDLIGLVGNFPQMANMAAVDEKATKTKNFDCVVANTNTLDLNVKHYFSAPEAVLRRFPIVVKPEIKEEFKMGDQLNSSAVRDAHFDTFDDAWVYTVESVKIVNKKITYTKLIEKADQRTYFALMADLMRKHKSIQDSVVMQNNLLGKAVFCTECNLPKQMCQCQTCDMPEEGPTEETVLNTSDDYRVGFYAGSWTSLFPIIAFFCGTFSCMFLSTFNVVGRLPGWIFRRLAVMWVRRCLRNNNIYNLMIKVSALLAVGAAGYLIYQGLFSSANARPDAIDEHVDVDKRPEYTNDERTNVYLSFWNAKAPIDVSQRSKCTLNTNTEVHHEAIINSTFSASFTRPCPEGGWYERKANLVHLRDGVYVTTSHCVWQGEYAIKGTIIGAGRRVLMTNTIQPHQFHRRGELIFFRIDSLHAKPMMDFLPLKPIDGSRVFEGHTLVRRMESDLYISSVHKMPHRSSRHTSEDPVGIFGADGGIASDQKGLVHVSAANPNQHARGDCGSPVVSSTPMGIVIDALHVGEQVGTRNVFAIPISRDIAEPAVEAVTRAMLNSSPCVWMEHAEQSPSLKPGEIVGDPHEKTPFGFIKEPLSVTLHGSITLDDGSRAFRNSHKSEVTDAITREYVTEKGYGTDHTAPAMRQRWVAVNYLLKASILPFAYMPLAANWKIAEDMARTFYSKMNPRTFGKLTDEEVINGVPDCNFISGMDMSKGSGYPYITKKRKLAVIEPGELTVWNDDVKAHIEECRETLARGERVGFVFNGFYKDEPVSKKKRDALKTRVICGCPIALQHLTRQYFLTILAEMTRVAKWEGAVGINATGPEWGVLARRLLRFGGKHIIAGDFEGFDWKTVNNGVLRPALGIFLLMAKWSQQYSEESLTVMRGLATEISHAYLDYFGDLLSFYANPSGQPLTTPVNCFVVSIVLRLCWIAHRLECGIEEISPDHPDFADALASFSEENELVTYGDDHALATNDTTFTFHKVKNLLIGVGMGYTAADKSDREHDFETLEQITFLKRGFVYSDGKWLAPLDLESIKKSLNAVLQGSLTPKEHIMSVLTSHHRELAFHTPEVFKEYTDLFNSIVDDFDLEDYIMSTAPKAVGSHFPTKEYYLETCFSDFVVRHSLKDDSDVQE